LTWLDDLTLETVIVHTTEGYSFRGLKRTVYDDGIVLTDVRLIQDDSGMSQQIDGEVFLPRHQIHFLQLLKPE
jgi:hypothetical protein